MFFVLFNYDFLYVYFEKFVWIVLICGGILNIKIIKKMDY